MENSARYTRFVRRLTGITLTANVCGAAMTAFYLTAVHFGGAQASAPGLGLNVGLAALATAGMFVLANRLTRRQDEPLWAWYRQASQAAQPEPAPLHIRQLLLNHPLRSAGITLVMWLLTGLVFGVLSSLSPAGPFGWGDFVQFLVGIGGISGPVTAVLSYFLLERAWKSELPLFFDEWELIETPAFRLSVRRRLLVLFVVSAVPLLLLAILSYRHAALMASVPQPAALLPRLVLLEVFLAGVGILNAIVLARTLAASLIEPLETLSQRMTAVQVGSLDEHVAVTSNDELGVLSTHFNSMVLALKQRDVELRTIYDISQAITVNLELDQTLQVVLEQVQRMIAYERAHVCLYDEREKVLQLSAWAEAGRVVVETPGQTWRLGEGCTGWVGEQRQSLLVVDVDADQPPPPLEATSYLGLPLLAGQKLVGTLELFSRRAGAFDEHDRRLLETIAPQASIAIANAVQVLERERRLKEQIAQLRIEIDEVKKALQVAEITGTEYFQQLREKARQIRAQKPRPG